MLKELINQIDFSIRTERLQIIPLKYEYINEFYKGFDSEITKYQYPDPFNDINSAKNYFDESIQLRKDGECLSCIITDMKGTFIGGIEVHSINTNTPELGIWIAQKYQLRGYGFEAVKGTMDYVRNYQSIDYFIYAADSRNIGSMKLINKLKGKKQSHEDITTESGKKLKLDIYYIR